MAEGGRAEGGLQGAAGRMSVFAVIAVLVTLNLYQYLIRSKSDTPVTQQDIIKRFHQLFDANPRGVVRNTWFGVPAWQNPNDVWITQEIITEVKPDFIVETGTLHGGSAAMWASFLREVNPEGRVITIDVNDDSAAARKLSITQKHVDFLIGSSTAQEIVEEVKKRVEGGRVLVILDSDHSKKHVSRELELYGELVSTGSYMIVQDTDINGHPVRPNTGPGPMEAVEAFLENNKTFKIDSSRERFLFTMHPKGYLKRLP